VLLLDHGFFYTYVIDASLFAGVAEMQLEKVEGAWFCCFEEGLLGVVLGWLLKQDSDWVICEPPEDPNLHVFN
jgi:hypothetical protein